MITLILRFYLRQNKQLGILTAGRSSLTLDKKENLIIIVMKVCTNGCWVNREKSSSYDCIEFFKCHGYCKHVYENGPWRRHSSIIHKTYNETHRYSGIMIPHMYTLSEGNTGLKWKKAK